MKAKHQKVDEFKFEEGQAVLAIYKRVNGKLVYCAHELKDGYSDKKVLKIIEALKESFNDLV